MQKVAVSLDVASLKIVKKVLPMYEQYKYHFEVSSIYFAIPYRTIRERQQNLLTFSLWILYKNYYLSDSPSELCVGKCNFLGNNPLF